MDRGLIVKKLSSEGNCQVKERTCGSDGGNMEGGDKCGVTLTRTDCLHYEKQKMCVCMHVCVCIMFVCVWLWCVSSVLCE